MTKQLRAASLLFFLAASLIVLAVGLSRAAPISAQTAQVPGVPDAGLTAGAEHTAGADPVLDTVAAAKPFSGWLALDRLDDYAQAAYQAELALPPESGDYTVELWLNNPDFVGSAEWPWGAWPSTVFARRDSLGLAFDGIRYGSIPPYNFVYYIEYSTNANGSTALRSDAQPNSIAGFWLGMKIKECLNVSSPCPPTGWNHLAYVYDHAANRHIIFWNGAVIRDAGDTPPSQTSYPIIISGAEAIDEVRFSSSVRYSAAFSPPASPFACDETTLALWHFDEVAGATVFHDACGAVDNLLVGLNGAHAEGVVLTPLTAVTISGPLTGTTGASHPFSAVISPPTATLPITYTWSPEPNSGQGTDSATYSWSTDGEKTIAVTAENIGGQVADSHTLNLHTPLTSVVITGPAAGMANTAYPFTAAASPPTATQPITYTWSPEPQSGQGTETATYIWATPGDQLIAVTAANIGGEASDSHAFSVGEQHLIYLPLVQR